MKATMRSGSVVRAR